MKRSKNSQST